MKIAIRIATSTILDLNGLEEHKNFEKGSVLYFYLDLWIILIYVVYNTKAWN